MNLTGLNPPTLDDDDVVEAAGLNPGEAEDPEGRLLRAVVEDQGFNLGASGMEEEEEEGWKDDGGVEGRGEGAGEAAEDVVVEPDNTKHNTNQQHQQEDLFPTACLNELV